MAAHPHRRPTATPPKCGYSVFWTADAAQWMRGKHTRREDVVPCNKIEYPRQDAVITYSHDDGCFYVAQLPQASAMSQAQANASSPKSVYLVKECNVSFKQLSPGHQKLFEAARLKEGNSLVSAGAVRVLTPEESIAFEEAHPECVLDSLWAERWKATDESELVAKYRWCVVGWQDPDIHAI